MEPTRSCQSSCPDLHYLNSDRDRPLWVERQAERDMNVEGCFRSMKNRIKMCHTFFISLEMMTRSGTMGTYVAVYLQNTLLLLLWWCRQANLIIHVSGFFIPWMAKAKSRPFPVSWLTFSPSGRCSALLLLLLLAN